MRALVVFESLAKVPMAHLLWDMIESAGLSRTLTDVAVAVAEDARDCKRKKVVAGRAQLLAAIGKKTAVLLVGNVALEGVTDKRGIKQKRGRPWEDADGNIYIPCLPPGMIAYDERTTPLIEADVRLFADVAKSGKIPRENALEFTIVDSR